jgi:hypothetical protein
MVFNEPGIPFWRLMLRQVDVLMAKRRDLTEFLANK